MKITVEDVENSDDQKSNDHPQRYISTIRFKIHEFPFPFLANITDKKIQLYSDPIYQQGQDPSLSL